MILPDSHTISTPNSKFNCKAVSLQKLNIELLTNIIVKFESWGDQKDAFWLESLKKVWEFQFNNQ